MEGNYGKSASWYRTSAVYQNNRMDGFQEGFEDPESISGSYDRHYPSVQRTIDEFTGDGILVFFGAPREFSDHTRRAVLCAIEMQGAMKSLNEDNIKLGLPELSMGIGINCGELVVGNIGSNRRKKYGAVGSPINVAFRVRDSDHRRRYPYDGPCL